MAYRFGQELLTEDQIEDAELELTRMVRSAESGEDWADIAWVEAEIISAKQVWTEANGQFGVGA